MDAGDDICCGTDNLRLSRAPRPLITLALILQLALQTNTSCHMIPHSHINCLA